MPGSRLLAPEHHIPKRTLGEPPGHIAPENTQPVTMNIVAVVGSPASATTLSRDDQHRPAPKARRMQDERDEPVVGSTLCHAVEIEPTFDLGGARRDPPRLAPIELRQLRTCRRWLRPRAGRWSSHDRPPLALGLGDTRSPCRRGFGIAGLCAAIRAAQPRQPRRFDIRHPRFAAFRRRYGRRDPLPERLILVSDPGRLAPSFARTTAGVRRHGRVVLTDLPPGVPASADPRATSTNRLPGWRTFPATAAAVSPDPK